MKIRGKQLSCIRMQSEKSLQTRIMAACKRKEKECPYFYYERRIAQGIGYRKGLPDMFLVYRGIHVEVELKREDGHLSVLQEVRRKRFEEMSTPFYVVRSLSDFDKIFADIDAILDRQ